MLATARVQSPRILEESVRAALAALSFAALLVASGSPARAEGAAGPAAGSPARSKKIRMAVLDIKTVGVLDPKLMEGLSALLASEVSNRPDFQVLGSADLRAMIGFDRERQLLGCTENSCMAEIGGALGVDYLLTSEGTKIGSTWALTFALLDVNRARSVKRISKRTNSEDKLIDVAVEGVQELLQALSASGGELLAAAPAPAVSASPAAKAAVAPVEPSPRLGEEQASGRSGVLSWSLVGGGLAAAAGGTVLLLQSLETRSVWDDQQVPGAAATVSRDDADVAVLESRVGVGLMGVGGAALAWGLLRLILPESSTATSSALLVPGPGSATLLFSTTLP